MSDIQNEADVVLDGRRNKLGEEAKAPLREQSVAKLVRILNEDNVGLKITRAWDTKTMEIGEQLRRQEAYLDDLDNFRTQEGGSNAFGGTSNLHIPLAFTVIKSYHARFFDALFSVDPPFSAKARREDGTDSVQLVEDLMKFSLMTWSNRGQGIEAAMDTFIWLWCSTGTAIMKSRWLTEYERYTKISKRYVPKSPLLQEMPDGTVVQIPQFDAVEEEQEVTERTQYCPQQDVINLEDFRIIGGKGDIDLADMLLHRDYMDASVLWTGVDRGIYAEEVVEAIVQTGGDNPLSPGDSTGTIKQMRQLKAGDSGFSQENERTLYEVIEACMKYDVDGSGITTEIVVLVEKRTSKILTANYLRRMRSDGRRPYAIAYFHKRPGEDFGMGLCEILAPLTTELDMMHNIRIDNALFQSTPFYLYRKKPGFDFKDIVLEPGMGIPVENPDDIFFPQLPNRTGFTMQEEQVVNSYIERLTGISDLSLGVASSTQGVTRTAAGVRAVMGENNSNLSIHLRRLHRGWSRIITNTWGMLKDYVESGFSFRVIGDDGKDVFRRVDDLHLGIDVDFDLSANSGNSNKSVQVEIGQLLYQLTGNSMDIQMGLVTADNRYAAVKFYLNALGVKDVHRFYNRPQGYAYILSPQEEFMRVLRGEQVPVDPRSDHQAFIAFTQTVLDQQADPNQDPGAFRMSEEQRSNVVRQAKMHEELMQAMQAQQAQAANMQQMQINSGAAQVPATYTNQGGEFGQVF